MVTVRPATEDDAAGIASVHVRGWQTAYRGIVPDPYLDGLDIGAYTERHRARLRVPQPDVRAWVADVDGSVAGFAIVGPERAAHAEAGSSEIYAFYVDPDRFREGVGRALIERVEEDLRKQGAPVATLWVLEANANGRRFYEACGWAADGTAKTFALPGFDGPELPEIRYRKPLT